MYATLKLGIYIHSIHTRQGLDLHYTAYNLTKVQKGVSFTGIRIFNNLPYSIKILSNHVNKFKYSLNPFASNDELWSHERYQ
jgi:hypothetical protein